jgi:hypothetical protein
VETVSPCCGNIRLYYFNVYAHRNWNRKIDIIHTKGRGTAMRWSTDLQSVKQRELYSRRSTNIMKTCRQKEHKFKHVGDRADGSWINKCEICGSIQTYKSKTRRIAILEPNDPQYEKMAQ